MVVLLISHFVVIRHPVTTLVTDSTNPDKLANDHKTDLQALNVFPGYNFFDLIIDHIIKHLNSKQCNRFKK